MIVNVVVVTVILGLYHRHHYLIAKQPSFHLSLSRNILAPTYIDVVPQELVAVLDAVYRTVKSEYAAADQISTKYSCEHLKIQEYADELFMVFVIYAISTYHSMG